MINDKSLPKPSYAFVRAKVQGGKLRERFTITDESRSFGVGVSIDVGGQAEDVLDAMRVTEAEDVLVKAKCDGR